MNQSERLEFIHFFVAAVGSELKRVSKSRNPVRIDEGAFAQTVLQLRKVCNAFAKRFQVNQTHSGLRCRDFTEGMTLALSAGFISRPHGSYDRFIVRLSPRKINELTNNPIFLPVLEFAQLYLHGILEPPIGSHEIEQFNAVVVH